MVKLPRGLFYRVIEHNVSLQVKYEHTNRMKEVTVTRLRLGKCSVNQYLHMVNRAELDKCLECKTSIETLEHYLLQCPNTFLCN